MLSITTLPLLLKVYLIMAAATPLTSSDAAAMDDRRLLELLLLAIVIHSLLRKDANDEDDDGCELKDMVRELSMSINGGGDQSAVSKELLLAVTQRLMDARLRLQDGGEQGRAVVSPSASDHQLMETAPTAEKKTDVTAAAAKMKKKRNKRNKAAAKQKGTKRRSWLGGGMISLLMIMAAAFGSMTSFSHIPRSDGSSEGNKAPPTLPPSTSTSLRQRDLQSSDDMASASPSVKSPFAAVVQAPIFSPAVASNPPMNSVDESALSTCFDTPNWEDKDGDGCKLYEEVDEPGCPNHGSLYDGGMGVANDNCCYCGGGSHTLPPTTSPKPSSSPTKSSTPSSSSQPSSSPTISARSTDLCFDTPNWIDRNFNGCDYYEENDEPGCPNLGNSYEGNMGLATEHCCYCGKGPCTDTPNWSDGVHGCAWYEENDNQGCPKYGELFGGKVMGLAKDHCCYCKRPVIALVTPSAPPSISISPTLSLSPSSSICTDTPGWYDEDGYDCVWYEVKDDPGCPQYGSQTASSYSTAQGSAKDNCCYCKNDVVNTLVNSPSSSGTCVDTPGWKGSFGLDCDYYQHFDDPECPFEGNDNVGEMGPAAENCCYCKDPSCEDFNRKCQEYTSSRDFWWTDFKSMCDKAVSHCCETAYPVKIVTNHGRNPYNKFGVGNQTVGLYNECKCDFWLRLCEDTRQGDACDYAAEHCCGDYSYRYDKGEEADFWYLNSPLCYCDFFNYIDKDFGHTLKQKTLNINKEFLINPCGQCERSWQTGISDWVSDTILEKISLEAIYEGTNGQSWTNNAGWMNNTVNHCQWYGISCDDEGFVTSIDLRDNNLVGPFPVYTHYGRPTLHSHWMLSKYGVTNLFRLKKLDLANNKLTGTIEYGPLYNLHSLTHFDVSGNQQSGEVEALVAPSLTYADFSNNSFSSMRRFQKYKVSPLQTLRYCDVSNNAIQEDVTDLLENIPPNIEQFMASNNNISGVLPVSLNNLQKLRQFKMASNALSGELPGFTESFATLQELDVSNQTNGFTGPIPEDIWRSLSLKILNLAGNMLTGTIPLLVGNLAVLEIFDVSNNLLESSIPAELGMLEGSLKRLDLSNNTFTGIIPSQIGLLQGASVFLKDNRFYYNYSSTSAPLSLCMEREVKEFDLENDTILCPPERNALSDFFDSAKGAEWTDRSQWLHEYASCCDWKGVTCDDDKSHVTKLQLSNNGLSGSLSDRIGNLTFIEVLDLSDNDIKGSIPAEIDKLKNINYLRLSYNAFTGAAPEGLREMKGLQLLQLQSNRITEIPNIPQVDNSIHGQSTFVTDCGVPSAFEKALECKNCTMCCNANEDCYPQGKTQVAPLNYGTFAAVLFTCFFIVCFMVVLVFYTADKRKNRGINSTPAMEQKRRDEEYALSKIGKNSVYSYFVTDKVFGWLAAVTTVGIQVGILVFFIIASEANLQDDKIDIKFAWKCPRDTDVCENKADLTNAGWFIFVVLMIACLAKDIISGTKLIYYSAKVRHDRHSRIRYFLGGMILCLITLFALYVSTVYNNAIATSNTELIVNSVIVLFVMELDEWIFSDVEAINKKWTAHAEDGTIDKMKEQIANQQEELSKLRESQVKGEQIASQQEEELRRLRELVEKILESQAAAAATTRRTASDSESVSECEGDTNARQMEQSNDITPCEIVQNIQQPQAAAATTPGSHLESDTEEDLQE